MKISILPLSIAAAVLTTNLTVGQSLVTYDDFSGATVDQTRWFQVGDRTRTTQSGGFLRMRGRGFRDYFGQLALRGLEGDFEIVLHFAGFGPGGVEGGFDLFAFDSEGTGANETEVLIGMGTDRDSNGKTVIGFFGEFEKGGKIVLSNQRISSATSGELRIRRSSNTASCAFRATGQSQFTSLGSSANFFSGNYVSFGIEVFADLVDGADVDCDKITVTGKLVSGVDTHGKACLDLDAIALGYPRLGNSAFRLLVRGGGTYNKNTWIMALGLQAVNQSLAAAGAPGCSLHISPLFVLSSGQLNSGGEAEVPLPVPNIVTLRGLTFHVQFAAATNRNGMGLATSNGVRCKIW